MHFPPRCFHSRASTAALIIDANVFRGHLAGAGGHSPSPQRARRCFRGAGRAATTPTPPCCGQTAPPLPHPTSPHLTKARPRQRSGSCRVSPSSPHLTTGRSAPRSPCPTPALPASRSRSPRRAGQGGRRAPAPRSPPAATSGRKQHRACAPPPPALEPRHVLPCSLRGAALRWRAAAPRGACAALQPRSMRTAAAAAAAATAGGSVPRQVLPLPGRRGHAPRRPHGAAQYLCRRVLREPPCRRARLLRRCRRRFKIGTRSGHRHRLPPSRARRAVMQIRPVSPPLSLQAPPPPRARGPAARAASEPANRRAGHAGGMQMSPGSI